MKRGQIITVVSVLFAFAVIVGCGGGTDRVVLTTPDYPQTYDPGVSGTPAVDPALILGVGWAWVDTFTVGARDGFSIAVDGSFRAVTDAGSSAGQIEWSTSDVGKIVTTIAGVGVNVTRTLTVTEGFFYHGLEAGDEATYTFSAVVTEGGVPNALYLTRAGNTQRFVPLSGITANKILSKSRAGAAGKKPL